jgi:cytochrome P450
VDDRVRELAPVVRLSREDIVVIGRFSHVSAALSDWRTFSSQSRPWHDPSSVRPEILLTDDPPRHTEVRVVIANALSPKALNRMAQAFAREAELVVERVLRHRRRVRRGLGDLPPVRLQGAARIYSDCPSLVASTWKRSATWCGRRWAR